MHLVNTMDEVAALRTWLGERRPVLAVDTETSGLKPHQDRIRLAQIGDGHTGWSIPWDRWGGVAVEVLQQYDGPLVLHHSKFDVNFFAQHAPELGAWPWHRTDDTMTMARVLDPVGPAGLKPLGTIHIDSSAAASQQILHDAMKDNGWGWDTVPLDYDLYWIYAALDTVITAQLWELLKPRLQGDLDAVYDLEIAVHRVVAGMERRGARIDPDFCRSKRGDLLLYLDRLREWSSDSYQLSNPGSIDECLAALERAGIDTSTFGLTDAGNVRLDKETLGTVQHPLAEGILNYRKAQKLISSYLDNLLEGADESDHVHPSIWPLQARTSRMSITNPALQTLPRDDPTIRDAFIPHPGNVLISSDYDQIEMRFFAHLANDREMAEAFLSDQDFFTTIAREIFADPHLAKKDHRRQLTKNTMYGKVYGAGVPKMAQTAGVPEATMEAVVNALNNRFPKSAQWQKDAVALAQAREYEVGFPYAMTEMGRRLPGEKGKAYTAVNYQIQGSAAEVLKRAIVSLAQAGYEELMLLPVHDEVVFDVPASEAVGMAAEIEKIMSDNDRYLMPITASAEIIEGRWGDKYRK